MNDSIITPKFTQEPPQKNATNKETHTVCCNINVRFSSQYIQAPEQAPSKTTKNSVLDLSKPQLGEAYDH